jgi:hypothetical protein
MIDTSLMTTELIEQKKSLVSYMKSKIKAEDWHAVRDAATDIEVINGKLFILSMQDKPGGGK